MFVKVPIELLLYFILYYNKNNCLQIKEMNNIY